MLLGFWKPVKHYQRNYFVCHARNCLNLITQKYHVLSVKICRFSGQMAWNSTGCSCSLQMLHSTRIWRNQLNFFQWVALNWYMLPCVAYVLHMVCETIYVPYQNLDKLLANEKKVFVKWPVRIELLKIKALDTPFHPTPVITYWRIWLNAVAYCA
jgi:hypothetical protein